MRNIGAGYDQISIPDCSAHGIKVSHTPAVVDGATADTAVFLMLGALRGFNLPLLNLRKGDWRGEKPPPLGHDPEGKVLGILGMGGIGRDMKRKAEALGMSVVYHNRKRLDPKLEDRARYVDFETLLAESDVISLNLPLNVGFDSVALCPESAHEVRLLTSLEQHETYHFRPAISANERWCGHYQYSTRASYG